jgi:hypothetical protein
MTKMIAAPAPTTQTSATPLSSVAPTTTSSTPASTNLGHQRVRKVRASRAVLWRAGLRPGRRASLAPGAHLAYHYLGAAAVGSFAQSSTVPVLPQAAGRCGTGRGTSLGCNKSGAASR